MWAIYWRFLLAVITVFLLTVFAINSLPILQAVPNSRYHPTVFWLVATMVASAISLVTSQGLVHAIWGRQLRLSPVFWGLTNRCLIGFIGSLAVIALIMQAISNPVVWANYKLYFQPTILILGPLLAGSFMQHQVKHNKML